MQNKDLMFVYYFYYSDFWLFFLRWMDGEFLELNGEIMEAELDEFSREIYKMSKLFQQKQKKIQQELKKTSHRTTEEKKVEERNSCT